MTAADTTMTAPAEVPDEWDFYLTRIDDTAASFFLNFWYRSHAPLPGVDTLYRCDLQMLEPGAHGLGEADDAERLQQVEERIAEAAAEHGLYFVGRIRWNGTWLLRLFGPPDLTETLRVIAAKAVAGKPSRKFDVDSTTDPEWSHYYDFLCPDDERMQWIEDRHVVESLMEHGDPLTRPRRVDHWIYFEVASKRDAFVRAAANDGYEMESAHEDATSELKYCAQLHRVDSVELEEIHDVVMSLMELAEEHDGEYDGWETSVERDK